MISLDRNKNVLLLGHFLLNSFGFLLFVWIFLFLTPKTEKSRETIIFIENVSE